MTASCAALPRQVREGNENPGREGLLRDPDATTSKAMRGAALKINGKARCLI